MTLSTRQIGIFGGSFNPIHCGHIALARHLLTALGLDEIWFVVSPHNPLKSADGLMPDADRLNMVRIALSGTEGLLADDVRYAITARALASQPGLSASDVEMTLPRPSYMWNTLCHLSELHPHARFTLLIGADNWLAFDRWAHSQDIITHYRIAVYPRPGYEVDAAAMPPSVTYVHSDLYPVSSTEIRRRIAAGESIEGMVPQDIQAMVEHYYR